MSDDMDFRFAVVASDLATETFRKTTREAKKTGAAADQANKGMARYADQARGKLEKLLRPARALAPEIDRLADPLHRVLKAGSALGGAFQPERAARASTAYRSTAKSAQALGVAAKAAASQGIASANDNLGAAATAGAAAGESLAGAATEAVVAGAGFAALGVTAGAVATGLVAVGVAAVGAEIAMAKFISPFANDAQQLKNMADGIGLATQRLQEFEGAGERIGVTKEATASSLAGLADVIHRAQFGLDADSIQATRLAGIKPGKRGAPIDVNAAALQAADAIAAQKNPQAQANLARLLGINPAALPLFRQGRAGVQRMIGAYAQTGDVNSDQQNQALIGNAQAQVLFNQSLHAVGRNAAAALANQNTTAINAASGALAPGAAAPPAQPGKPSALSMFANALAGSLPGLGIGDTSAWTTGAAAGGSPSGIGSAAQGAPTANGVRAYAAAAAAMLPGIVGQESNGQQANSSGGLLRSNKGAIGAAQLLPDTARRAAAWAGIQWDPKRFYDPKDKGYSVALGQAELQRLLQEFGGNRVLAAAAYNAGEGRLLGSDKNGRHSPGWLERFGDPRKGQVSDLEFAKRIPFAETRDYVLRTQFGDRSGGGGMALASAPQQVQGEILVKVDAPANTKVIARQSGGGLRLKVARSSAFVGA